jgi:hypothetical protein
MAQQWYYSQNGRPAANPVSLAELQSLAIRNELRPSDMVWNETMTDWTRAGAIPELFATRQQLTMAPVAAEPEAAQPILLEDEDTAEAWPECRRELANARSRERRRPQRRANSRRAFWYGAGGGIGSGILVAVIIGVRVIVAISAINRPAPVAPAGGWPALLGGKTNDALRLNEQIVDGWLRLEKANRGFDKSLEPFKNGRPADLGRIRAAYAEAKRVMEAESREGATLQAAAGSLEQQLVQSYLSFLSSEERLLPVYMRLVSIAENASLNNWDKGAQITNLYQKDPAFAEEERQLDHLRQVQHRFAAKHNVRLIPADPLP